MKKIITSFFVGFLLVFSLNSCTLFNTLDCIADGNCSTAYQFTLEYSVDNIQDSFQIDDTILIKHELPFLLAEDNNGVEYNLEGIAYNPLLIIGRLEAPAKNLAVEQGDFEFISVEEGGNVFENLVSTGKILREVEMFAMDDKYYFEIQMIAKAKGEFTLNFAYWEDDLLSTSFPNIDTCCNTQSMYFDYLLLNAGAGQSRFEEDSLWYTEESVELNLLEIDRRYDMFVFEVF